MEHSFSHPRPFTRVTTRPLFQSAQPHETFPIQSVQIDWELLIAKRPVLLKTEPAMPAYLLKPEILQLLSEEKHSDRRLMMEVMWCTGARVSELLELRAEDFLYDGYNYQVILQPRKRRPGRPRKAVQAKQARRVIPLCDPVLIDHLQTYLVDHQLGPKDRLFPTCRQTVNRHVHALVDRLGGAPFSIHAHTFRHSFAIHLLLHSRPLKLISQLLGHRSIESTEIYTNVLTMDSRHFLEGVPFH